MENNRFDILKRACVLIPDNHFYIVLKAKDCQNDDIIWAIGDDQVCMIAGSDFIMDGSNNYEDVCIRTFPYQENTPESVGEWLPLIKELVHGTLGKYMEHNGAVRVYPQWMPEDISFSMGQDVFQRMCKGMDYIILHSDSTMEMVPKTDSPAMDAPSL